mmetsp:Transcript_35943/g.93402  ORF Transcript_35943/g.93402 Transcript_35943/m.93402 type:complete len:297 (+) Transcript_35943:205-1095(+)
MERLGRSEPVLAAFFFFLALMRPKLPFFFLSASARARRALSTSSSSAISPGGSSAGSRDGVCSRHCSATLMKHVFPRFFRPTAAGRTLPGSGSVTGSSMGMASSRGSSSPRSLPSSAAATTTSSSSFPSPLAPLRPVKPKQAPGPRLAASLTRLASSPLPPLATSLARLAAYPISSAPSTKTSSTALGRRPTRGASMPTPRRLAGLGGTLCALRDSGATGFTADSCESMLARDAVALLPDTRSSAESGRPSLVDSGFSCTRRSRRLPCTEPLLPCAELPGPCAELLRRRADPLGLP